MYGLHDTAFLLAGTCSLLQSGSRWIVMMIVSIVVFIESDSEIKVIYYV